MITPYNDNRRRVLRANAKAKRQGPDDSSTSDSHSSSSSASSNGNGNGNGNGSAHGNGNTDPSSTPPPTTPPPSSPPPSTPPSSSPTSSSSSSSSSSQSSSDTSPTPPPTPSQSSAPPEPTKSSTTSSVPVSTIVQTLTTNPAGQTVYTSYVTSVVVPTTVPVSNSSNNNAPIIGGVIGAVVGASVLGLLIYILFWHKRRQQRFDDNMFDPNQGLERPGRLQGDDLDLAGAAATPYVLPSSPSGGRTSFSEGMQHHGGPASIIGAAGLGAGAGAAAASHRNSHPPSAYTAYTHSSDPSAHQNPTSPHPSHSLSPGSEYGTETDASSRPVFPVAYPASSQIPGTAPPSGAPGSTAMYDPRSAKEREAMTGRLNVRNEGGSAVQRTPDGVVVHQDGGRYREDEEMSGSNEIPPTYDSIRHDSDGGSRA